MTLNSIPASVTLEKKKYFNYDLICMEFTVYTSANRFDQSNPFLFAQSFSDRIKLWWPTDVGIQEYLKAIDSFFQAQKSRPQNHHGIRNGDLRDDHDSWDIYLYLNTFQVEHIQVRGPSLFAIDPFQSFSALDGTIRLCRITLPGIDFYYDMEPHENGIKRAGVVTNSSHDDFIFDYLVSTHIQHADEDSVRQILREIVSYRNDWEK